MAKHLEPGAVLTDVGTLEVARPVDHSQPRRRDARFVGGHPLAGTEESGWAAADPLLFRDAPWALALETDTDLDAWLGLASLVCDLGAKPLPTTAAEQDAAIARVIGLPHVLAEALALTGLAGGSLGLSLAAGSYRDGLAGRPHPARSGRDLVRRQPGAGQRPRRRDRPAHRDPGGAGRPTARCSTWRGPATRARMDWEHRRFEPVELAPDADLLRAHGRRGGWITAVLRDDDGDPAAGHAAGARSPQVERQHYVAMFWSLVGPVLPRPDRRLPGPAARAQPGPAGLHRHRDPRHHRLVRRRVAGQRAVPRQVRPAQGRDVPRRPGRHRDRAGRLAGHRTARRAGSPAASGEVCPLG